MNTVSPPRAKIIPHVEQWHGFEKRDDYHWLKAENWQEVMHDPARLAPDIATYLAEENAYQAAMMADTRALQNALFEEMKGRIKQDDSSVPAPDGPYLYYTSYVEGGQHPRYMRKPRDAHGAECVLLDGNELAKAKAYFEFGGASISPDHKLLAWSCDDKGSEFYTLFVRNTETGEDLADEIINCTGGAVWAKDGRSFYYTEQDGNHRPLKIFRHFLGQPQSEDALIYHETDEGLFCSIETTSSERFALITSGDHDKNETRLIDLQSPDSAPHLIAKARDGFEYDAEHWHDQMIFKTNRDGAEDYKIMWTPLSAMGEENWKDLIPARPGIFITGFIVFNNWLVRMERENALPRIVVRDMHAGEDHAISFDEEAYSLGFGEMREFDSEILRFTYSSPTTPTQVFDYDMRARTRVLRKSQVIPSGHDASHYVTQRLMAPAHDGELIPVTLLFAKTTQLDVSAPLWLYGYGSYGMSMPASFSTNILSLVDRGVVYALAHIRGGQEKGRAWYKAGKLQNKPNSFHDFISVAQTLVDQKFTSAGRIIAQGGSAGGMVMGAIANLAPQVFGGIIADVPFVDVLTTMLDDTLPLTPPEWPEWGNPIESAEAYKVIADYAPYEQVARQDYPAILAVGGLTDPRVTYWEPAKWVAKLRAFKTDDNLLLLKINMEAGHGGASGRFDHLKEVALGYAFGLKVLGLAHVD